MIFLLEGIYSDRELRVTSSSSAIVKNFLMKRCRFQNVYFSNSITDGCQLEHCRIKGDLQIGNSATNFSCINSVIEQLCGNSDKSSILYENTIIHRVYSEIVARFINCILGAGDASSSSYRRLHSNSIVTNCLSFYKDMFIDVKTKSNCWYSDKTTVWGTDKGYDDTYLYELTEEAKKEYIGSDGTEIGIHGGHKPFSSTPSHPQITKRDIATKTSGGKLKVDITVEAQDD